MSKSKNGSMRTFDRYDIGALVGSILGSAFLAFNIGFNQFAYLLFIIGSACSIAILRRPGSAKSLLYLNIYFLCINCLGLIRHS